MGQLVLRLEKRNLGGDLRLGVVARVRQVKDAHGSFPEDPVDREVVIPAGTYSARTVDDLPSGTYRIDARLPSGQVLRATSEVTDAQPPNEIVFQAGQSSHEWLSFQRLAGNVPSEAKYEEWVGQIAKQIDEFAKAKSDAAKPIEIDPATIRGWARFLYKTHVMIQPALEVFGNLRDKARNVAGQDGPIIAGAEVVPPSAPPVQVPDPPSRPEPVEFELLEADPLDAKSLWDVTASMAAWTEWRKTAAPDGTLAAYPNSDRAVTLWRIDQNERGRRIAAPSPRPAPWQSLAVLRRGEGVDVILLPVPWPMNPQAPPATLEILREAGIAESGRTTLTVRDESVGSMIMYLSAGRMADAATVLREANRAGMIEDLISDKLDNPFAACAAAYVGFATLSASEPAPAWTGWLGNLMDFFEWLPDGAVIRAAYLLKTAKAKEDLDASLLAFKTAYGRGIPFYSAGLQHLMTGLYTFSETDAEAKAMHRKVASVASRADAVSAFTQITIVPVTAGTAVP